jgi:hypothetical protein
MSTTDKPPSYEEDDLPTADKRQTHLKLLEAFFKLRKKVEDTDGLFGLYGSLKLGGDK